MGLHRPLMSSVLFLPAGLELEKEPYLHEAGYVVCLRFDVGCRSGHNDVGNSKWVILI